jgi:hypothetical protein
MQLRSSCECSATALKDFQDMKEYCYILDFRRDCLQMLGIEDYNEKHLCQIIVAGLSDRYSEIKNL